MNKALKALVWGSVALVLLLYGPFLPSFFRRNEVFVVPDDFRGVAYVLFDQPNGTKPEFEWWSYVYRIPRSGVLRVQTELLEGFRPPPEIFRDSAGRRVPFRRRDAHGRPIPGAVYASHMESGSGGCPPGTHGSTPRRTDFLSFIVSDKQHLEHYYSELREHEYTPKELICTIKLPRSSSADSTTFHFEWPPQEQ